MFCSTMMIVLPICSLMARRHSSTLRAATGERPAVGSSTAKSAGSAICRAGIRGYFWNWRCGGSSAAVAAR